MSRDLKDKKERAKKRSFWENILRKVKTEGVIPIIQRKCLLCLLKGRKWFSSLSPARHWEEEGEDDSWVQDHISFKPSGGGVSGLFDLLVSSDTDEKTIVKTISTF